MSTIKKRKLVAQVEKSAQGSIKEETRVEFLDTGSINLNLAGSQKGKKGGWARGRIVNIVGDGSSGKTLLALEAAANAYYKIKNMKSSLYPPVKKIFIVYNNVEGVMDFPLEKMFGKQFVKDVIWVQTDTCEKFRRDYLRRVDDLKKGEFLLYIIDSLDALKSEASKERTEESLKKDKEEDGSYGMEKAKYFSANFFSHLCGAMENKDATLMIISQVRQNINVKFGEKYYRTGGKGLDFYTHQVCWLAVKQKLKKVFRGKERIYGIVTIAKFKRNKTALPFRDAEFTILFDYGIDDISSMLDYLYGPKDKKIEWHGEEIHKRNLPKIIDENKEYKEELINMVETDWKEIEEKVKPHRRPKF